MKICDSDLLIFEKLYVILTNFWWTFFCCRRIL